MENIGAGIAALGVFGPGIGIGILAGLSAQAIGRNPDAAGQHGQFRHLHHAWVGHQLAHDVHVDLGHALEF